MGESWRKIDHALVLKLSTETKPFLTRKCYVSLKVAPPLWIKVAIKLVSLSDFQTSDMYEGGKGGSRSRFTENKTVLSQFTKNKDNENHGSRRIKHLFLVSRKIILQNHPSRLLSKSRFTRKKLAISHFTGKKRADHESRKYPLPPSCMSLFGVLVSLLYITHNKARLLAGSPLRPLTDINGMGHPVNRELKQQRF